MVKQFFLQLFFVLSVIFHSQVTVGQSCSPSQSLGVLDVNNVKAQLPGGGNLWWDGQTNGYEVPKGSGKNAMFAGGLWIGDVDGTGALRIATEMYRQFGTDFYPGPLDNTGVTSVAVCNLWDHHWQVTASDVTVQKNNLITYSGNIPISAIPPDVLNWPGRGNPFATGAYNQPLQLDPMRNYAPFVDVNSDAIYDPTSGDYPAIKGDKMVWWIFNDAGNVHQESGGSPLQIEVHCSAYAFAAGNAAIANTTYYNYEIINRGTHSLDSIYLGHFLDFNVGVNGDFAHFDSIKNLLISYYGDTSGVMSHYGAEPPAMTYMLLKGPEEQGNTLGISSVTGFENNFTTTGNPQSPADYYAYLSGSFLDGTPFSGKTGALRKCIGTPIDDRIVISSGPFSLHPAGHQSFHFALTYVEGTDLSGCSPDFTPVYSAAASVKSTFEAGLGKKELILDDVKIFPNPAEDQVKIVLPANGGEIKVLNMRGQVVDHVSSSERNVVISRKGLPAGVYLLRIRTAAGNLISRKLLFK